MSKSQDVKKAYLDMGLKEKFQSEPSYSFPKDHRPWGQWFESLTIDEKFQVAKKYTSIQVHLYPFKVINIVLNSKLNHWIVVSGVAEVTIDSRGSKTHQRKSVCLSFLLALFTECGILEKIAQSKN